ncbi:DUF1266 domain-containing protein [Listeria costaricensis]|uniref:DUF1266 domain-containing protein n=1 Tax=Listeria costaricensis TaxID=2026604 RepID=UPI000C07391B|nr:DUF1266 domain-containing protein [Listeria costaricensis]
MFSKKKMITFIEENQVAPDLAPYLGLGALYVEIYAPTSAVLAMHIKPQKLSKILIQNWGITSREGALGKIIGLLEDGRTKEFEGSFAAFQAGNSDAILDENFRSYEELLESCEIYNLKESDFQTNETIRAWDFEQAAFIIRAAHYLGYLKEEEVWNLLQNEVAPRVKEAGFKDWQAYGISVAAGRSFCEGTAPIEILYPFRRLLNGKGAWKDGAFL